MPSDDFEQIVSQHYEPLYRFAFSLTRHGGRRVRSYPANILYLGDQRPPVAGSQQGQVVVVYNLAPGVPEYPQAGGAFSTFRAERRK